MDSDDIRSVGVIPTCYDERDSGVVEWLKRRECLLGVSGVQCLYSIASRSLRKFSCGFPYGVRVKDRTRHSVVDLARSPKCICGDAPKPFCDIRFICILYLSAKTSVLRDEESTSIFISSNAKGYHATARLTCLNIVSHKTVTIANLTVVARRLLSSAGRVLPPVANDSSSSAGERLKPQICCVALR
ncbi:hypothetical protein HZH66_000864 [Vespula vulgaris]|uniref:Uncharacterized protein n=1 Tax=Vespula vulgaris TaxID=7454 RepID=A0A834KSD8_VESVU|nr:hypothetical protein HZH66_000864 [Vespula vulgaris]